MVMEAHIAGVTIAIPGLEIIMASIKGKKVAGGTMRRRIVMLESVGQPHVSFAPLAAEVLQPLLIAIQTRRKGSNP